MRVRRSTPPADAPAGTKWFGGPVGWFSVSVKVTDPDLNPDLVSKIFETSPTESWRRGVPILRADGTEKRIPKFGHWSLAEKAGDAEDREVARAVLDLLNRLPANHSRWLAVAALGKIRLSLALTLETANQGISFAPDLLSFLGQRSVSLDCDIYSHDF